MTVSEVKDALEGVKEEGSADVLRELIARLEAAVGPDRELDAEMWLATTIGATRKKWSYIHTASGRECHIDETRTATGQLIVVPEFTSSIDAALTLVPEGWFWWVGHLDETDRRFVATISKHAIVGTPSHKGFAPTTALALCIAACKARPASTPSAP